MLKSCGRWRTGPAGRGFRASAALAQCTTELADHQPNPIHTSNPYVPDNMPAVGDLFDMFDFD